MLKSRWILLTALFSFQAIAGVSFSEKEGRVAYLEELTKNTVPMNIEAFRRELEYERHELPLEQRAQNEANLLAEKVKLHVQKAYESSLEDRTPEEAYEMVREEIEKDLTLVDAELQDEIRQIAYSALQDAQTGGSSIIQSYAGLEKIMLKSIQERVQYLNEEPDPVEMLSSLTSNLVNLKNQSASKKSYRNKAELVSSLVSDGPNAAWSSTSHMTLKSDDLRKAESKISLRVSVNFMGVGLEAGPAIMFNRTYRTHVSVVADGLNPVLGGDGNFDFVKRDRMGRAVQLNGKNVPRHIAFTCDAALDFETEYSGSGGFSISGVGASNTVFRKFTNTVNLSSRMLVVPEAVGNQSVTYRGLIQLCHQDFLKAKVTNTLTVAGSLNVMMRNIVSSLRFSHPQTKCMKDTHCYNWFNKSAFTVSKKNIFPRCLEHRTEKFRSCYVRGLQGQNCPVYENGKRTSSGEFEYTCDTGLKCVKYQNAGWLKPSKGKCMPINPRTYKNPYTQVRAQTNSNVIYVDLVRG